MKPIVYFAGKISASNAETIGDRIILPQYPADSTAPLLIQRETYTTAGPVQLSGGGRSPASDDEGTTWPTRTDMMRRCVTQINAADLMVATLDTGLTCYGTLAEIGLAYAMHKLIVINWGAVPPDAVGELWFVLQMSLQSLVGREDEAARMYQAVPRVYREHDTLDAYTRAVR